MEPTPNRKHRRQIQSKKQKNETHNNQTKIDEYTRVSTPRSEMLFKKGYLSRKLQCFGTFNAMPSVMPNSSSSASGSIVSNEETASYYSIQSLSPAHGTTNDSDTTSATYPNDIYDPDMSLYYSSGFYDNNGYFYVNRMYRGHKFSQFLRWLCRNAVPAPRAHF